MKKPLYMILALTLAFGTLTGCGSSSKTEEKPSKEVQKGSESKPAESKPAGSTFKIGGTGPLTGGAAIYGNAAKNGAQIAVDEINALGGSIQFELKYEDDEHDAEKAVNAYNKLKDWGMQLSLGSVTSTPGVAVSSETYTDRIFALTPSASAPAVIEGKDNVYQMCFADPNQGFVSAQYIKNKALGSKIAVIYKNDDVYSKGIYDTFASQASILGLAIVSATTFTEDSQTDFSVQLTEAKNSGADLVFLPLYYAPVSLILQQAKAMDYAPKYFGVDGMDGILTMDSFDTSLAEGVMLLTPFSADAEDERTQSFVKKYKEAYGDVPNQFAADAYDCIYAYKMAIEASESTSDMSPKELCDAMIKVFPTLTFKGLTGEAITWAASGEVSKGPKGMVIQNGTYVGMD